MPRAFWVLLTFLAVALATLTHGERSAEAQSTENRLESVQLDPPALRANHFLRQRSYRLNKIPVDWKLKAIEHIRSSVRIAACTTEALVQQLGRHRWLRPNDAEGQAGTAHQEGIQRIVEHAGRTVVEDHVITGSEHSDLGSHDLFRS